MTEDLEIEGQEKPDLAIQSPEGVAQNAQDMLSKSTVSKIVERERSKAFEKGKQEALMELQAQAQGQVVQESPVQMQQQASQGLGGMPQLSQADIERMIQEQAPRMLQEHVQQLKTEHTVNSFVNKMQQAEEKYPGIQERLNELDFSGAAPLIQMANDMPNTADIMHELMNNPMKMGNLLTLMYSQPRMAQKAMLDLSSSINQNETAKAQEAQAQDPMSQLRPSQSAGIDDGAMSVVDFRKMFKV